MKIIGVIPARLASTRLKEKVLVDIAGKPMIQRVYEQAKKSKYLDDVLIACDDQRILDAVVKFGGKAVLTSKKHPSGTDRIAEAVKNLNFDIIVNIQGDEPLIHPSIINNLAKALLKDKEVQMATVIKKIKSPEELYNSNVVKVVVDDNNNALYFSRAVIPHCREDKDVKGTVCYKHLGLYAYRKKFLFTFRNLPQSSLEKSEKLEQLRVLQAGYKIKTVLTDELTLSVDTQKDLEKVRKLL